MPTDIRISPSVTSETIAGLLGTPECVVLAGCEIKVSVPPRLTASLDHLQGVEQTKRLRLPHP